MDRWIANPRCGERIRWLEETPELLRFEYVLAPGAHWPGARMPHVHPKAEERFEVVSGTPEFRVGGRRLRPGAGDKLAVPPGVVHRFRNAGETELHLIVETSPSLRLREVFEVAFGWGRDGKAFRFGNIPKDPLKGAVFADDYGDEVVLAPAGVVGSLLGGLAGLARRLGRTPDYERYLDAP